MSIGEGILTNGVTEILKKLVPVVAGEIGLAWGVKDELKKLKDTLEMILAVIADAEKKQNNDAAVRLWLRRLKDVAYDADDVMDAFSYETMRRSARGNKLKNKVRDFVSSSNPLVFRFKMAKEIKNINQRLDLITKDMISFQLQIAPACDTTVSHGESSEQRSRQTDSSVNESIIMGREYDKKIIIDMLTSSDRNLEKISIISIVGMGGLGKTTLAQFVYNDQLVKEQFKLRMWVHVSEYFDVEKLFTKIMESATGNKFDTLSNFDVLARKVREQLDGKKYLLVLDDLWSESDEQWERLCSPLLVGAQGSKILITTRKSQVADVVKGNIPPYKLGKLQDDQCWSIIGKKAFSPGGAQKTTKMTSIGEQIAKKCCGLPLAAKFLGSLMRSKNREVDWLSIQENDIWNTSDSQSRVMPILKLSYDNLSSPLKQCFSYCSIFPKGWEIDRVTLVQLWIAEGFLDSCNVRNGKSVEDIADEYFESLVWTSFLEGVDKSLWGDIRTCKMHDLVHDLAEGTAGGHELMSLMVSELKNTSEIRRLQFNLDVDLSSPCFMKNLTNAKKLRTLFILEDSNLCPDIILRNQHLRVLLVDSTAKLSSLSCKLRHLRYLHLTYLDFAEVVNGFVCINTLYNLESLVLNYASNIESFLANIQPLKKLKHLNISNTVIEELPDSVSSLCNLQTLDLKYCKLKALPESVTGLKNLRFLDISHNPIQELPRSVKGLNNLKIFEFECCSLLERLPEDFGALTQLRYLNLDYTAIKSLPESCVNLINLEFVDLSHCKLPKAVNNWTKVRSFASFKKKTPVGIGKLVCLESLKYWVRKNKINDTRYNDGIEELCNLNSLEKLCIMNLQNVKDPKDAERANLKGKRNLLRLQLCWGKSKVPFDMNRGQVFEALQPHIGLKKLKICNFMGCELPIWMCVPTCLPYLERLELETCKRIIQLPAAIGQLQHLTSLTLVGLMSIKSLDIREFPSLTRLYLTGMFSLENLWCSHPCPSLQVLDISYSTKLTEIPSVPSLKGLRLAYIDHHQLISSAGRNQTSLTWLHLENVKELVYFPISILQNHSNLQDLRIERCSKFLGFRVNEDQESQSQATLLSQEFHSGCIQTLYLVDCPVLKFLPDLRRWTSLQNVTIQACPEVKESLDYDLKSLLFLKSPNVDFIDDNEPGSSVHSIRLAVKAAELASRRTGQNLENLRLMNILGLTRET